MRYLYHKFGAGNGSLWVLSVLFSLLLLHGAILAQTQPKFSEAQVTITDKSDITRLQQMGLEVDHFRLEGNQLTAIFSEKDLEILNESGLPYQILVEDVAAKFLQEAALSPAEWQQLQREMDQTYGVRGFEFGSMGGFYTFDEVVTELDSMRLMYPNLISVKQSIGQSHEGRDIWVVKISDNPDIDESEPEVLYTALHHAREPQSMMTLMYFMYYLMENYGTDPDITALVNNRELYFIPVVNPDGYVYNQTTNPNGGGMWRKNRRNNGGSYGVDLNRNYGYKWGYDNSGSSPDPTSETYRGPAPFSEPETAALRDFCNQHDFRLALNYHTYGDLLIHPWAWSDILPDPPDDSLFVDLCQRMVAHNGYTYGTPGQTVGYSVNGDANDWMYGEDSTKAKIFSMTPEVGPSFWPSPSSIYPLAQENLQPNLILAEGPGIITADPLDPNPPANVTAYSDYQTPNSVLLSWTDPTSYTNGTPLGAFTIEIFRDGAAVASVNSGLETYTDTGLNDGQNYIYDIYTKDSNDSLSFGVSVSVWAGGAPQPKAPTQFFVSQSGNDFMMHWVNPSLNIDNTPMDDLAGIRLYEDGNLVATFTRSSADTGKADSALYTPPAGTHQYYVTAIDNESPLNESAPSNVSYSPLSLPFADDFGVPPVPNPGYWLNTDAEITNESVNPPSAPYALALDGHPAGGDKVELLPVDLSGMAGQGLIFSYWYQPQGNGNAPEAGDSLIIEFKNNLGQWVHIRSYPGTSVQPFVNEIIALDAANPGSGATFFHPSFQARFRNIGTSSSSSHFDHWFVDNVVLGTATNNPHMTVSPRQLSDTLLVGATNTLTFQINNNQPAPSSLNFSISESPAADWVSVSPESGVITSNQMETVSVLLDASSLSPGDYSVDLIIAGNDTTNSEDTVTVQLRVNDAPVISVQPDSVAFQLAENQEDSTRITIANMGGGPLVISSIEVNELSNALLLPAYIQKQVPSRQEEKGIDSQVKGEVTEGSGGPDPFGYKWIDSDEPNGPAYAFTDISATGTVINLQPTGTFDPKDEGMATINLPFSVKFYGQTYNQLQVNSNGFITFDMNYFANAYTNQGIPNNSDPNAIVAPFWDDLDGSVNLGDIYYEQIGNKFIIQWNDWAHYNGNQHLKFQVVLFQNSATIYFVYENMDQAQSDVTVGIENADGTAGLQIAFDQAYAHSQLLTKISKGAEWLSVSPTGGTVAPGDTLSVLLKAKSTGLAAGNYLAQLAISSNDPILPVLDMPKVSLQVTSNQPSISFTPTTLVFDSTEVGQTATLSLQVNNLGGAPLTVSQISSSDTNFTVSANSLQIPAASSQSIDVTFAPKIVGPISGQLTFQSNDPAHPSASVAVQGIGYTLSGILNGQTLPREFALQQNYPNPFNPTTTIKLQLPAAERVVVSIYNVLGQKVRTLVNRHLEAGYHQFVWDARNDNGEAVASGIYLYKMEAGSFKQTRKMILMR
ncbi:MAG: hypothetical protein Kow0037_10230 [Calditrichia bacterium]